MNGNETPTIGMTMTVQWTDGSQYQAQYQGTSAKAMYTVSILFLICLIAGNIIVRLFNHHIISYHGNTQNYLYNS